jgi:hypothetical protein
VAIGMRPAVGPVHIDQIAISTQLAIVLRFVRRGRLGDSTKPPGNASLGPTSVILISGILGGAPCAVAISGIGRGVETRFRAERASEGRYGRRTDVSKRVADSSGVSPRVLSTNWCRLVLFGNCSTSVFTG